MGLGVGLALLASFAVDASSHREAPGITKSPKVDATDLYLFRSFEPGRDGFVTLLAVGELLVFMGVVAPAFDWHAFTAGGWAGASTFGPAAVGGMIALLTIATVIGQVLKARSSPDNRTIQNLTARINACYGAGSVHFVNRLFIYYFILLN